MAISIKMLPERRADVPAALKILVLVLLLSSFAVFPASAGETVLDLALAPKTMSQIKELMGDDYSYFEKDDLLIVSDLDKQRLYQLALNDFHIYTRILKAQFFDRQPKASRNSREEFLTIFLFRNRDGYVDGLRKMGRDVAAEDEKDRSAVRDGYYYPSAGYVIINYSGNYERGIATFAHELVHALIDREYPFPPTWLNEGFATMIGNSRIVDNQVRPRRNSSLGRVKSALNRKRLVPLRQLFQLTGREFGQTQNHIVFYDASEQFCRFLQSRNQLLTLYRTLRDAARNEGETGFMGQSEKEIEIICKATGFTVDNLEKVWHRWIQEQK